MKSAESCLVRLRPNARRSLLAQLNFSSAPPLPKQKKSHGSQQLPSMPYYTRSQKNAVNDDKKLQCDQLSTSEYGTASADLSDLDSDCCLSRVGWDSDCDDAAASDDGWESDAERRHMSELTQCVGPTQLLTNGDVFVLIPQAFSGGPEFHLRILRDPMYVPRGGPGAEVMHVAPVVSLEPHGVEFYQNQPAYIFLPLQSADLMGQLTCLCSDTPEGSQPKWERLLPEHFFRLGHFLVIATRHFSLFTAVAEDATWSQLAPWACLQATKRVRCRVGGCVRVAAAPGVEVTFPRGVLVEDLEVTVRVWMGDTNISPGASLGLKALASPVVMVAPHGYQFRDFHTPVTVQLPVPDYNGILTRFFNSPDTLPTGLPLGLSVWQSETGDVWEKLEGVPFTLSSFPCGLTTVTFPVQHFSFFKVLWDVLTASLYEAKMGMSYFYPYISFSMMCQAFMEENQSAKTFSLEVICYRSDRQLPESNYKHRVGSSTKPKLVRPGRISVQLKSKIFEADVDVGEEISLSKEELDFRGRDFEKQYACRYIGDNVIEKGTFGKVVVERVLNAGRNEPLFEFNLFKSGAEGLTAPPVVSEEWLAVPIKELACTLITEDNWRKFARHIGFTRSEIKHKLQHAADPFMAILTLYQQRGGTPDEFVQALYAVSREIQLRNNSGLGGSSQDSRSSHNSSGKESKESRGSRKKSVNNSPPVFPTPWPSWLRRGRNEDDDSDSTSQQSSRKRPNPSKKGSGGSSAKKPRRQFSDVSETVSSSSEESDVGDANDDEDAHEVLSVQSAEKYKNDNRKLNDTHLWNLSSHMNNINWRALGRTLGMEESILQNIEHAHKSTGFRECAYQMLLEWKGRKPRKCTFGQLYSALLTENMNSVAKQMSVMNLDSQV